MIVSKFGGSTFVDVKKVVEIIKSNPERQYVIASAPGESSSEMGITDMLFMCHSSFYRHENYNELLDKIKAVYEKIINSLGIYFDIDAEILELKKNLLSAGQKAELDFIGSRGEYITAKILAKSLGWDFVDASEMIFFKADGNVDEEKTFKAVNEKLKQHKYAVIPGFYGSLPNGSIKTFSRGDGDSSGAIVACAVNADLFEKWSETAKVFSANPAVIPDAKIIKNITFMEAVEMNYTGIKIIKDSVLFMLKKAEIPLKIYSLNDSENEGMLISSDIKNSSRNTAVCISGRKGLDMIHIEKYGLNKMSGFGEKLFGLFSKYRIPCEHCLSGIHKMSLVVKSPIFDLNKSEIFNEIKKAIQPNSIRLEKGLSIIAVIGQNIGPKPGTFAKVFSALAASKIVVKMIDQGSDDLNIIVGVSDNDYENAVRALYQAMI